MNHSTAKPKQPIAELSEYWISHPKSWFPSKQDQPIVDQQLWVLFSHNWIASGVNIDKDYIQIKIVDQAITPVQLSNLILYHDQLTRHFRRLGKVSEQEFVCRNQLAMQLTEKVIETSADFYLPPSLQVFMMLPYRHSCEQEKVQKSIDRIQYFRQKAHLEANTEELHGRATMSIYTSPKPYIRFLRAALKQMRQFNAPKLVDCNVVDMNAINQVRSKVTGECEHEGFDPELEFPEAMKSLRNVNITIGKHIQNHVKRDGKRNVVISASGGVDSNLLLICARQMQLRRSNFVGNVCAVHINYKNRPESDKEVEIIKWICKCVDIELYVHEMPSCLRRYMGDRAFYENEGTLHRFSGYQYLCNKLSTQNGLPSEVWLGHIKDDVLENIFANIGKRIPFHRLCGMSRTSIRNNVRIARPLLTCDKQAIWDCAREMSLVCTINTTPNWSRRGMIRNQLKPMINAVLGQGWLDGLMDLALQMRDFGQDYLREVIEPAQRDVHRVNDAIVIPGEQGVKPLVYWQMMFEKNQLPTSGKMFRSVAQRITTAQMSSNIEVKICTISHSSDK